MQRLNPIAARQSLFLPGIRGARPLRGLAPLPLRPQSSKKDTDNVVKADFSDSERSKEASSSKRPGTPTPPPEDDGPVGPGGLKMAWQRIKSAFQYYTLMVMGKFTAIMTKLEGYFPANLWFKVTVLFSGFLVVTLMGLSAQRHAAAGGGKGSPAPREVLYSSFLQLVRTNKVQQARFDESNRVYIMLKDEHRYLLNTIGKTKNGVAAALPAAAAAAGAAPAAAAELSAAASSALPSRVAVAASRSAAAGPPPQLHASHFERHFYARRVPDADGALVRTLTENGVEFGSHGPSWSAALSKVLTTLLILWLPLMPMIFLLRRALDGRNGTGSKTKGAPRRSDPVTFDDVAGVGGAKDELVEVVLCLKDSARYSKLNAKMPTGVLLSGPPGTGKTLLARAVAGEAGVPFFAVSASEFVELYVGRGAARVRELFGEARKRAPCVIFIDELDAVGARRGAGMNEERDQTLNQLLTELDGFEGRQGILLLAATNRPDVLDPALLRPGRLSRRVEVPLPDQLGRKAILQIHMRRVPLEEGMDHEVTSEQLARATAGFSGAELANVVNEAALMAARRGADAVGMNDLADGVFRTKYGANASQAGPGSQLKRQLQDALTLPSLWGGNRLRGRPGAVPPS